MSSATNDLVKLGGDTVLNDGTGTTREVMADVLLEYIKSQGSACGDAGKASPQPGEGPRPAVEGRSSTGTGAGKGIAPSLLRIVGTMHAKGNAPGHDRRIDRRGIPASGVS